MDETKGKLIFSKVRRKKDGMKDNNILDVWLFQYEGEANLRNATTEEVKEIKWMTKEEIGALMERNELVPTMQYFFSDTSFMN